MIRPLGFVLIALFAIGCASKPDLAQPYIVKVSAKETSAFGQNVSIKVKTVNDSRCPKGCECIWAGEVKVFVNLKVKGNDMDTCLVLPSQSVVKFNGYSFELKDVVPYPVCDNQSTSDYIFTFQVSVLRSV